MEQFALLGNIAWKYSGAGELPGDSAEAVNAARIDDFRMNSDGVESEGVIRTDASTGPSPESPFIVER
jgi:hypothetical protein